jgi:hypothetical protein
MHIHHSHHAHITPRLALRHQLQIHGPTPTPEEAQVIDNKQARLKRLINTFEHGADRFLFHQDSQDDLPNLSVSNYAEYDQPAQPDSSIGMDLEQHASLTSQSVREDEPDGSGMDTANPADIPILLPSTLGWEWCVSHGVQSLALKEAQLRLTQVNDSIHKIRLDLGFKSALFRTQVRLAKSQKKKTRAWSAIDSVERTVHEHARVYSMARDAYLRIHPAYPEGPDLPQLLPKDLHVATLVLGSEQTGQRNRQQSWIWSFGQTVGDDGTWMDDCKSRHS